MFLQFISAFLVVCNAVRMEVDYVNVPPSNEQGLSHNEESSVEYQPEYVNTSRAQLEESDNSSFDVIPEIPSDSPTRVSLGMDHSTVRTMKHPKKKNLPSGTQLVVAQGSKQDEFRISWPTTLSGYVIRGADISAAVNQRQQQFRTLRERYPALDLHYLADLEETSRASFTDLQDVLYADSYAEGSLSASMKSEKEQLLRGPVSKESLEVFKFLVAFDAAGTLATGRAILAKANGDASKAQELWDEIEGFQEKFAKTSFQLEFPRDLDLARSAWPRVQRLATALRLFRFQETTHHLTAENLSDFETQIVKRALQKLKEELKLKFKSFVFMFDIDDTVLHLDGDLQNLGYGLKPQESDKIEAAMQRYFNDYPGLVDMIDRTFPSWWEKTGSKFFDDQDDSALGRMRDYLKACIKQAKEVGETSRVVFNHERKGVHSRMVGHIFPEFQKVLRVIELLELPIAFTSKNPFIKLGRVDRNNAGAQFEAKLRSFAQNPSKLKIWYDFNSIGGAGVNKPSVLQGWYEQGLHGLYFDDSAEFFDPSRTRVYLNPAKTGFAAAHVNKSTGVTMSDVLQSLLVYQALRHDTKGSHEEFPVMSLSPAPAVTHLISW